MNLKDLFTQCVSRTYQNTLTQVSYATERFGKELRIWFEASNGALDWMRNLNFPARPYGDCKSLWFCHRGFLGAWKEVRPFLAEQISAPDIDHITVTGYSHGAAVALLCHEYAVFHRPDIADRINGFGFGCPRVVWGPTPRAVQNRFLRFLVIRNLEDLVTHLPPAFLGFHHVSPVLEIGQKGRYSATDAHRPEHYLHELHDLSPITETRSLFGTM